LRNKTNEQRKKIERERQTKKENYREQSDGLPERRWVEGMG